MNLSREQLLFLKKELDITEEDIKNMSAKEWGRVREECFFIEADELYDLEIEETKQGTTLEESERCQLATSIADIKFSQLKSKNTA